MGEFQRYIARYVPVFTKGKAGIRITEQAGRLGAGEA